MKINDAYNLLLKLTTSADNADKFKKALLHYDRWNPEQDIRSYLEFIRDETYNWLLDMPSNWQSERTLSKPKTAIVKLLEQPQLQEEYGKDFTLQIIEKIDDVWTRQRSEIMLKRKSDTSVLEEDENVEYQIDPPPSNYDSSLKQENVMLAERLEQAESKIELLESRIQVHKKMLLEYIKIYEDSTKHAVWEMAILNI